MTTEAKLRAWLPSDPAVRECWDLVLKGVDAGWLTDDNASELIDFLSKRQDWLFNELGFEFLGDSLRVSFHDDTCMCSPDVLVSAARIGGRDARGAAHGRARAAARAAINAGALVTRASSQPFAQGCAAPVPCRGAAVAPAVPMQRGSR